MNTIFQEPSSKLIYYRLYQSTSPYSVKEIDIELLRRKYISFEKSSTLEDDLDGIGMPNSKLISRSFVRIQDEEVKIDARGKNLNDFCFNTEENLLFTLHRLLKNGGDSTLKEGELPSYLILNSNLTWSERVLLNYISKKMQTVLTARLKSLNKDLTESLDYLVEGPSMLLESENPALSKVEHKILREKLLQTFFKNCIVEFKQSICSDDIGKFLPIDSFLIEFLMCGNPIKTIKERLIPSRDTISIWDSLFISSAIKEEESIILTGQSDILTSSIDTLKDSDIEIAEKIKHYCLEPLKSSKK